ncbi:helix-turn-helix domain-containing protein [Kribbella sp. WER1]
MYDERTRATALAAIESGESLNSVSKRLGISRAALREWRDRPAPPERARECPRCGTGSLDGPAYVHLLGLYLGDGCLSKHRREVYALRIACDDAYRG